MKSIKRFSALTALLIIASSLDAGTVPTLHAGAESEVATMRSFAIIDEAQPLSLFEKGQIATEMLGTGTAALLCGALSYGCVDSLDQLGPKNYLFSALFAYITLRFGELTLRPLGKILG